MLETANTVKEIKTCNICAELQHLHLALKCKERRERPRRPQLQAASSQHPTCGSQTVKVSSRRHPAHCTLTTPQKSVSRSPRSARSSCSSASSSSSTAASSHSVTYAFRIPCCNLRGLTRGVGTLRLRSDTHHRSAQDILLLRAEAKAARYALLHRRHPPRLSQMAFHRRRCRDVWILEPIRVRV